MSNFPESVYPSELPQSPLIVPVFTITLQASGFQLALEAQKGKGKNIVYAPLIDGNIKTIENKFGYKFEVSGITGADKISVNTKGIQRLDCDLIGKTPNGSNVFLNYPGIIAPKEGTSKDPTDFDNLYLRNTPVIELSDDVEEEYKWVETKAFIGKGRILDIDSGHYVQYIVYVVA